MTDPTIWVWNIYIFMYMYTYIAYTIYILVGCSKGAGMMSQQLRVLVDFSGDSSSVPRTHTCARVHIHIHLIKNKINVNFFLF